MRIRPPTWYLTFLEKQFAKPGRNGLFFSVISIPASFRCVIRERVEGKQTDVTYLNDKQLFRAVAVVWPARPLHMVLYCMRSGKKVGCHRGGAHNSVAAQRRGTAAGHSAALR